MVWYIFLKNKICTVSYLELNDVTVHSAKSEEKLITIILRNYILLYLNSVHFIKNTQGVISE